MNLFECELCGATQQKAILLCGGCGKQICNVCFAVHSETHSSYQYRTLGGQPVVPPSKGVQKKIATTVRTQLRIFFPD